MADRETIDAADYCDAICPHCGGLLCPRRDQLGETIICKDTGKEFVLTEFKREPFPNARPGRPSGCGWSMLPKGWCDAITHWARLPNPPSSPTRIKGKCHSDKRNNLEQDNT